MKPGSTTHPCLIDDTTLVVDTESVVKAETSLLILGASGLTFLPIGTSFLLLTPVRYQSSTDYTHYRTGGFDGLLSVCK